MGKIRATPGNGNNKKKKSGKAVPSGSKNGCMRFFTCETRKSVQTLLERCWQVLKFGLRRHHPTGPVSHWEHSLK